jgi:hypothetical protein
MSYNPIEFGGYDFTGARSSKPSVFVLVTGNSPSQLLAFLESKPSSFPQKYVVFF